MPNRWSDAQPAGWIRKRNATYLPVATSAPRFATFLRDSPHLRRKRGSLRVEAHCVAECSSIQTIGTRDSRMKSTMKLFTTSLFYRKSPDQFRRLSRTLSALKIGAGVMLALAIEGSVDAQIFISNANGTNGIGSYNFNGTAINASLFPHGAGYQGLALSGSNLYVSDNNGGSANSGLIAHYNINSGLVNSSLVTGLNGPYGLAVSGSGSTPYVANFNTGIVGAYNTSNGAATGGFTPIITSPTANLMGVAVSGNSLFVTNTTDGKITAHDATTGAALGGFTTVTGLSFPAGIAVSGSSLYVANSSSGSIGEYNAVTGAAINANRFTGLNIPANIAVNGTSLFVTSADNGTVGEYSLITGLAVNASLITGLSGSYGIAVSPIPEPSTYAAIAGAAMLGLAVWQRRRQIKPVAQNAT
jgi:hypothetical protein